MDTYNKSCQIAASKRQLEDAKVLYSQKRWLGSIYLGGYAVECSLKSLICYEEDEDNFKETTPVYQKAWDKVSTLWRNAELRYSEELGTETDSKDFIEAAEKLHKLFLHKQGIK